ncbi:hypothetical protein NC652_039127 [Populus alba x Populus x berolinensis]|nr:hypothetical protein NC652_039127 [Populus alba x Populus x berolinensis]
MPGFSGNAYLLISVALTAGELEEGSREAKIEKIKQAKNSVNSDYVNAHMEALDGHKAAYLMQNPNDPAGIDVWIGLLPPSLDAFSRYFLMNVQ